MMRLVNVSALIALCLAGFYVSSLLLQEHLHKTTGHTWFDEACGETDDQDLTDCDKVIQSEWGMILGMPSAYWGMAYFLGMGLWFLFVGQPSYAKRYWHSVPTLANMAGAAGAVFFIVIMYTRLEHRCFWCMVSHAINFTMLISTLLLWPKRPETESREPHGAQPEPEAEAVPLAEPSGKAKAHPSTRLALAIIVMVLFAAAYLWQGVRAETAGAKADQTLKAVTQTLYKMYQGGKKRRIKLRRDDPQKTADDARRHVQVVLFSDFECGHCRRFSESLEKEINPLFDNHLRIVFKHYPLCPDCNPHVKKNVHPHSCKTARAAEAARMQGGNDAFWKAHDILFKRAGLKMLGKMSYRKLAETLGLDADRFVADMESAEVAARIREDIQLARSLGVTGTPTVFVDHKQVPRIARTHIEFWKQLARLYKARTQKRRKPAGTRKPATRPASTPGTPGHGGDP